MVSWDWGYFLCIQGSGTGMRRGIGSSSLFSLNVWSRPPARRRAGGRGGQYRRGRGGGQMVFRRLADGEARATSVRHATPSGRIRSMFRWQLVILLLASVALGTRKANGFVVRG